MIVLSEAEVANAAWGLFLNGAESHIEDAMDENGDYTEEDWDRVVATAHALVRTLRQVELSSDGA